MGVKMGTSMGTDTDKKLDTKVDTDMNMHGGQFVTIQVLPCKDFNLSNTKIMEIIGDDVITVR